MRYQGFVIVIIVFGWGCLEIHVNHDRDINISVLSLLDLFWIFLLFLYIVIIF